jgi:REP element-mobilizing transposase RayT
MTDRPRRKRIRLDHASYAVPGTTWHVSTNTENRFPAFRDPEMAATVVESIEFQCRKTKSDLLLYCVMPDHVHLVISIGESDLISILQAFKSYTSHQWTKRTGRKPLWQESFHDHGVRRTENMDELVKYVVENPQEAEIVSDWQDYPWIGGSLFEDG